MTNSVSALRKKQLDSDQTRDPTPVSYSQSKTGISKWTVAGGFVVLATLLASDAKAWQWMHQVWSNNPDYSHGLIVPAYSVWLLWHRRELLRLPKSPSLEYPVSLTFFLLGVSLISMGIAIRCAGIYTRTITLEAVSILSSISGIILCCGGWRAAIWAWPAVFFLVFMIPLPGQLGGLLSSNLQSIATVSSTYFLQTIGIPAVSEGNVIWLTDKPLGVAEACSGIRMLTTFFALAVGVAFVINRSTWEKCLLILSAPIIAILSNFLRITATALAYECGDEKIAERIFHDLAGWMMMPAGLLLLWTELFILSKLFQENENEDLGFHSNKY